MTSLHGKDLVFHQAAIRITQCAEEPRLALEVLVDGTFNVVEAAAEHKVSKLSRHPAPQYTAWRNNFPPLNAITTTTTETMYGAAKTFGEGLLRSFHAMKGLDYVSLRYFNVYGPQDGRARPLYRGSGAMDGAHRRW